MSSDEAFVLSMNNDIVWLSCVFEGMITTNKTMALRSRCGKHKCDDRNFSLAMSVSKRSLDLHRLRSWNKDNSVNKDYPDQ